ncbi:MAG: chorismate mutase [Lachnospiraceae bacterium]|nr:chorismate mutase [Lachnospiraceae bacterium]
MKDLTELRKEIDVVDAGLLDLLIKRFDITEQIGEYKAKNNQELFCPEREEEKKQALRQSLSGHKNSEYLECILCALMDCSKYQQSNNTYSSKDIYLIGMPGCGKSTIGRMLAEKIQRDFIDMDLLFRNTYNITSSACIKNKGEGEFRSLETELLKLVSNKEDKASKSSAKSFGGNVRSRIISCGGGIVVKDENRPVLKKDSVVIYIKRDLDKLSSKGRPLSAQNGVEALYEQRKAKYESWSDHTVENNGTIEECLDSIIRIIKV